MATKRWRNNCKGFELVMEALAVKYRPQTLNEIVSQEAVSKILMKQVETNTFKNCYLFCGPSGTGKTTTARAFSRLINGSLDGIIEIDAASNNGVENIRNIISSASERAIGAEYKVYIIDECHVLTNNAWQALLKTLEEPPRYTLFMLCTTNPEKIPPTILNRVQRFNLQRIPKDKIRDRLFFICKQEGFTNYKEACDYISKISNGQMRDAIANLDKCATFSTDLSIENVLYCLGNYSYETFFKLTNAILDDDEKTILSIIDEFYYDGKDLKQFISTFIEFMLDMNKFCLFHSYDIIQIPNTFDNDIQNLIAINEPEKYYNYYVMQLSELQTKIKTDISPKTTIEIYMMKMARLM